jgi:hypothetical protein
MKRINLFLLFIIYLLSIGYSKAEDFKVLFF